MLKCSVVFLLGLVSFSYCFIPKPEKYYSVFTYNNVLTENELILTPMIENGELDDARKAAEVNHADFKGVKSYSGFFTVNKIFNSNTFFWYFPAEEDPEHAPVILWLQGGPGDSSLFGLFVENGPFEIKSQNAEITLRDDRWTKKHSVIYMDNPVGVGFSYTTAGGHAENQTQVGAELYEALQQFFTLFPNLQGNDFFVAGESYGGKYSTSIAYTIQTKNPTATLKINLKGVAIDSGLVDPLNQHNYADYLYQVGLVDCNRAAIMKESQQNITDSINNQNWMEGFSQWVSLLTEQVVTSTGLNNFYNFLNVDDPTLELKNYFSEFLNRTEIRSAIHVGNRPYVDAYYEKLIPDILKSVAPWFAEVVNNYRVIVYNGQLDIIVAYPLTVNFLKNLQFNDKSTYESASRAIWKVDNELAGYVKVAGNLQEVLVRKAGHLIAYDQPKWANDLIYKFVRNTPIA